MPRVSDMLARPPRGSAAEVKYDAYMSMNEEERDFLHQVAGELRYVLIESGKREAATWLESQLLDVEEMLALFWILPSHVRSALKRGAHET